MRKINEMLAVVILSLLAVLFAAVGLRAYHTYIVNREMEAQLREQEEILVRNREANDRVLEMRQEIQELSQDRERLARFLEELQTEPVVVPAAAMMETASGAALPDEETENAAEGLFAAERESWSENDTWSENTTESGKGTISGNDSWSGNTTEPENGTISENETWSENTTVSGNGTISGNESWSENTTVSGNGTISGNESWSENTTVSGNDTISGNVTWSANTTMSGNLLELLPGVPSVVTLEERRQIRSSLEETLLANEEDRLFLAGQQPDFSDKKIACLGDSITAAANLEGQENYPDCSYPSILKEILGAAEVYNLGIGGSSIGRYWSDAFVDRYQEIPADVDIILVMGGTNDGFCLSEKELGTLTQRKPRTFCGDLDELMRGLKENYPEAEIYFVTPLPNILQDYLMRERDYLLPQKKMVDIILSLSAAYDFHVIDLYNSNILDSHDADIVADYMPDGVHCNEAGYRILAEHIAAQILNGF